VLRQIIFWQITFKVNDVFAVAIKENEVFQQQQKCGGEKLHKGRSPTVIFRSPSRRKAAQLLPCVICRLGYLK